ncbi:MAG TPA: hypothetical protein DCL41_03655 [Bdellovibrionales bacterium]|nr:hypothetical protein [Pseudobdellovibrionaceae bacterium]HAG90937.1 hypothetical protein [Bdellovibrionales bacterium]
MISRRLSFFLIGKIVFSLGFSAQAQLSKSSAFLAHKVQVSAEALQSSGLHTTYVALVKSRCITENKLPKWLPRQSHKALPEGLSARSIVFDLKNVPMKQFYLDLESPCILGVADQGILETTSLDPRRAEQLQLPYLKFEDYSNVFKSPLFFDLKPALVAVVDSGISLNHPDLKDHLWTRANGSHGFNFMTSDPFDLEDGLGHGTHVAGIIGAIGDNGVGVIGLSQNVRFMVLKTQDDNGQGSVGNIADAIRYAADQGADVINLSLAMNSKNALLEDAINYALEKGSFLVAATGNNAALMTLENFYSPASYGYGRNGLISVASVDSQSGVLSDFSNHSITYAEMAAPGSHGITHILSTSKNEDYRFMAGTSMAAPHVAGAAAQVISYFKSIGEPLSPAQVEEFLKIHSRRNVNLNSYVSGGRELDLKNLSDVILHQFQLSSEGGLDD